MAKLEPLEKIKHIDTLWSLVERVGVVKTVLITLSAGGAVTFAVSWLQHLPHWLLMLIVFVAACVGAFVILTAAVWVYVKVQKQIMKVVHRPLEERVKALENSIGPRRLSPEQRTVIWNTLGTEPGKIRISAINPDTDAATYADEIAEFLRARGWDVWGPDLPYEGRFALESMSIGMFLLTPHDRPVEPYEGAQRLAKAFDEAGIAFHYHLTFEIHKGSCELWIGHRGTSDRD